MTFRGSLFEIRVGVEKRHETSQKTSAVRPAIFGGENFSSPLALYSSEVGVYVTPNPSNCRFDNANSAGFIKSADSCLFYKIGN